MDITFLLSEAVDSIKEVEWEDQENIKSTYTGRQYNVSRLEEGGGKERGGIKYI